jgi:hypothetical protein
MNRMKFAQAELVRGGSGSRRKGSVNSAAEGFLAYGRHAFSCFVPTTDELHANCPTARPQSGLHKHADRARPTTQPRNAVASSRASVLRGARSVSDGARNTRKHPPLPAYSLRALASKKTG